MKNTVKKHNLLISILLIMSLLVVSACGKNKKYLIADKATDPYYNESYQNTITEKKGTINKRNKKLKKKEIHDTRVNTVRKYSVYWVGIHVADMIVSIIHDEKSKDSPKRLQKFTTIIRTFNIAKLINGFKSETKSLMVLDDDGEYKPVDYSTSYSMRKKYRDITLKYSENGSDIIKETNIPPEKRWKRKEVPIELKSNTPDPLTFVFQVREKIRNVIENGGQSSFILPLYDGRRRTNFLFTVYGLTKDNLIRITFEEKPVAGYTNNELKEFKKGSALFTVYLSQKDFLPVWAQGHSFLGTAKIILKKYCKTLRECIAQL